MPKFATVGYFTNYLSGVIPHQVFGLSLLLLNLSYNSLSGNLPIEVGNLKNKYLLHVSESNLSGEIPLIIGSCLDLNELYLQGNSLKGTIPSSMTSLKSLEYFDVTETTNQGKFQRV